MSCTNTEIKGNPKYNKVIFDKEGNHLTVDVYDVIDAWELIDPGLQHALKKVLQPGLRGHKSVLEDYQDAIDSIERAKILHLNREKRKCLNN